MLQAFEKLETKVDKIEDGFQEIKGFMTKEGAELKGTLDDVKKLATPQPRPPPPPPPPTTPLPGPTANEVLQDVKKHVGEVAKTEVRSALRGGVNFPGAKSSAKPIDIGDWLWYPSR